MNQSSKKIPKNRSSDSFPGESHQTFKELIPVLKLVHKTEEVGTLSNSVFKASVTLIPKPEKDTTKKKKNYRPIFHMNIDAEILKKNICRTNSAEYLM